MSRVLSEMVDGSLQMHVLFFCRYCSEVRENIQRRRVRWLRRNEVAVNSSSRDAKGRNEIQVEGKREGSNQRMWNCGPMMLLALIQLVLVLVLVLVRSDIGM